MLACSMCQLQNVLGIAFFLRNTKEYGHYSNISHKLVPCGNYTLRPAIVKVLDTSLQAILWKPFQLLRRILNNVSSITLAPSLQFWFQSKEHVKNQLQAGQESMGGCSSVVTLFFAQKSLTKNRPVCWSIAVKEKSNVSSPFSKRFLLTASLRRRRITSAEKYSLHSNCCKLYQRIPGIFEAITYNRPSVYYKKSLVHYLDPATCVPYYNHGLVATPHYNKTVL
jgi:hypothetical protein